LDIGFPLLCRDLSRIVAADSYMLEMRYRFNQELEKLQITYTPWEILKYFETTPSSASLRDSHEFRHEYTGEMIVSDIDLHSLRDLGSVLDELRRASQNLGACFTAMPGSVLKSDPVLFLTANRVTSPDSQLPKVEKPQLPSPIPSGDHSQSLNAALTVGVERKIHLLTSQTFRVRERRPRSSQELEDFFQRLSQRLKSLILDRKPIALESLLGRYIEILKVTAVEHDKIKTHRESVSYDHIMLSNPLEREFYEFVRMCVEADDREILSVIFRAISQFYFIGTDSKSRDVCKWALNLQAYLYRNAVQRGVK